MDSELTEAELVMLNKIVDDVEKLNQQLTRFAESMAESSRIQAAYIAMMMPTPKSEPEPLFEDQSTQPEKPSQVSIPEVAACDLDDPSDVKVDRSNDDDQVSSDLLLSSDSVLIEVAPKTKQTPYLILELQKEVISKYFTNNYSSALLDDEVVMELDETHELKLKFSFSNLNLILCSPSVCQYVYMDWTSYLAMRGNSVCNQGYLLRQNKKMRFGKPPAKPPDDVVICAAAEAYRVWLQSEVVKWEYANCGVIFPFLLPPAKPPDECLSLQEYNIWCWTKCWDLALSSIQKGLILSSNWQGQLNTIKADAKGSKEEIYSLRVKCVVKKDKPYKWILNDALVHFSLDLALREGNSEKFDGTELDEWEKVPPEIISFMIVYEGVSTIFEDDVHLSYDKSLLMPSSHFMNLMRLSVVSCFMEKGTTGCLIDSLMSGILAIISTNIVAPVQHVKFFIYNQAEMIMVGRLSEPYYGITVCFALKDGVVTLSRLDEAVKYEVKFLPEEARMLVMHSRRSLDQTVPKLFLFRKHEGLWSRSAINVISKEPTLHAGEMEFSVKELSFMILIVLNRNAEAYLRRLIVLFLFRANAMKKILMLFEFQGACRRTDFLAGSDAFYATVGAILVKRKAFEFCLRVKPGPALPQV